MKIASLALLCSLAFAPGLQAQVKERAVALEQTEAVVTVTKVDREARTVTFRGPKGGVATLIIPAQAQNLDKVKPGQQYRMKYLEAVALEIRKGGAPSAAAGEQVKVAPKGATPGGIIVTTQQIAGVVDAIDYTSRYLSVRGPKGNVVALKVADDVAIDQLSAGDRISITHTEALAVEMVPQKAAAKTK
jgi:hypothetical protein